MRQTESMTQTGRWKEISLSSACNYRESDIGKVKLERTSRGSHRWACQRAGLIVSVLVLLIACWCHCQRTCVIDSKLELYGHIVTLTAQCPPGGSWETDSQANIWNQPKAYALAVFSFCWILYVALIWYDLGTKWRENLSFLNRNSWIVLVFLNYFDLRMRLI